MIDTVLKVYRIGIILLELGSEIPVSPGAPSINYG